VVHTAHLVFLLYFNEGWVGMLCSLDGENKYAVMHVEFWCGNVSENRRLQNRERDK
jgi:hypothetical protein